MPILNLFAWIVLVLIGSPAFPSSDPPQPDALALLKQAGQHYADAKTYHIEAIEENTSKAELRHEWTKSFFTAIEASGHRYRFADRSANGSSMVVSDGKTEWLYHVEDEAYTRKAATEDGPTPPANVTFTDFELFEVVPKLRETLASLDSPYQSAESLPDEVLDLDGQHIDCKVVRLSSEHSKKPAMKGTSSETRIWIEKDNHTIRKIVTHTHGPMPMAPHISEDTDTVETFPVAELDGTIADDTFVLSPPVTARQMDALPSPFSPAKDLTGKPAPAFVLKNAEGKEVSLASLRGKNVLLDFWATWCIPCVASMPQMAGLYQQTKDKGLVFIGIDEDEDAATAANFLSKRHETWPNFHDEGGEVGKAFKKSGIPTTVLIDSHGIIVYYKVGYGDSSLSDLRAAITKLGPEFAAIGQ